MSKDFPLYSGSFGVLKRYLSQKEEWIIAGQGFFQYNRPRTERWQSGRMHRTRNAAVPRGLGGSNPPLSASCIHSLKVSPEASSSQYTPPRRGRAVHGVQLSLCSKPSSQRQTELYSSRSRHHHGSSHHQRMTESGCTAAGRYLSQRVMYC